MCEGAQEGRTPLWWASSKGHKEVMEVLLAHGANVDTPDKVRPFPSSIQPAQPAEWSLYV